MKVQTTIDAQEYPIEAVTLYSKRAEVRRVIALELKAGRNDLAITNLPSSIVPDTFHISGLSAGQASVVDTTCVVPKPKSRGLFGTTEKQKYDPDKKAQARIQLEIKKNQLLRAQSLIHAKNDILLAYARTLSGENTQREDFVEFLTQFNEAGQESLEATSQTEAAVEEVEAQIRQLDLSKDTKSDDEEEEDLSLKRKTKAGVVISAKEDCSVKLTLSYVVSGASWTPAYELHAVTDSATKAIAKTVTLHYRASITQNTGEDWDDVNLTLSTAELSMNMAVPTLLRSTVRELLLFNQKLTKQPLFGPNNNASTTLFGAANNNYSNRLQPVQQQQQQSLFGQPSQPSTFGQAAQAPAFGQTSGPGFGASAPPGVGAVSGAFGAFAGPTSAAGLFGNLTQSTGGGLFGAAVTEPHRHQLDDDQQSPVLVTSDPELQPLEHVGAEAKDQVLASTYRVDTAVRVQSHGTPHRVTIMTVQLAATTEYVAVPKLTRAVYLQCKVQNTSPHQFPPGPMVTYLDSSYIEKSDILLVLPKGTLTRSLGTDPAIRVTFKRSTKKKEIQHAAFAQQTITIVTDMITLKNTRASVVPRVFVRHGIPTPGDDRFRVTLKEPDGLAQVATGVDFKLRDKVNARWIDDGVSGNETTGLMLWSIEDLVAEGTEEFNLVYEVTAPEGVRWTQ